MTVLFEKMLVELNDGMTDMGQLIEDAIVRCVYALRRGDVEAAQELVAMDDVVDHKERELENLCLRLLLTQHPVARDMRFVSAALKMLTDMERIGDQAADIGEIVRQFPEEPLISEPQKIQRMGDIAVAMVHQSVEAFLNESEGGADMVIRADDEMDSLFNEVKGELVALIAENSVYADQAVSLLMIAKYLEKIGDYAVNVSEWAKYLVSGVHKEYQ